MAAHLVDERIDHRVALRLHFRPPHGALNGVLLLGIRHPEVSGRAGRVHHLASVAELQIVIGIVAQEDGISRDERGLKGSEGPARGDGARGD